MAEPIKLDDAGSTSAPSQKINIGAPSGNAPPAPNGGGTGNIFTQTQGKKEESKIVSSIISQKEVAQKTKSILGPAPTLEKSIEQEKEASQKRKLRFYQFVFVVLFLASGAMAFYFYSELSPDFNLFGANTTQRLTDTNESLRNAQTLVNRDRYLAAQLTLNEFSYQADRFLSSVSKVNDPAISSFDKRAIFADLDESKKALPVLLGNVRDVLTKDIVVPTYHSDKEPVQSADEILAAAQNDLKGSISDEKKKYGNNPTDPQDILDVKLIDNATKLVGNKSLVNALQATSVDSFQKMLDDYAQTPDPQKLKAVQDVIGKVLSSTKSDLATIADIKHSRVEWSAIIGQIKEETLNVDKNFDQPLLYDTLGGIVYNGYEFDSNSDKLVLSGTTKTLDGSNFTLMSNLIDQLENSPYFQEVDMRSFSKSKQGGIGSEGYIANFKIDLRLETPGTSNNKTLNLKGSAPQTTTTATGVNRSAVPASSTQQSVAAPASVPSSSQQTTVTPSASVTQPSSAQETGATSGSASAPVTSTQQAAQTAQTTAPTSTAGTKPGPGVAPTGANPTKHP